MKSVFFRQLRQWLYGPGSHSDPAVHRRLRIEWLGDRMLLDASGFDVQESPEGEPGSTVPDFTLTDVNPNSSTFNQGVSPHAYFEKVTGWYFTHST
jgi:hypothetical protein